MAAPIGLVIGSISGAVILANEEWSCRSLSAFDGYLCPTIECELTSGAYLGTSVEMSVGDLLEALCVASKGGAISEFAVAGYKSETPQMKKIALNENLCKPKIKPSDYLDLIVAPDTEEEAGGLLSRLLIVVESSKVTRIVREVRTSKCFWERGL